MLYSVDVHVEHHDSNVKKNIVWKYFIIANSVDEAMNKALSEADNDRKKRGTYQDYHLSVNKENIITV